jgi:hypothetical protein
VAENPDRFLSRDNQFFYLSGETQIGLCDFVAATGALVYVKRMGRSSFLSHLFLKAPTPVMCSAAQASPDSVSPRCFRSLARLGYHPSYKALEDPPDRPSSSPTHVGLSSGRRSPFSVSAQPPRRTNSTLSDDSIPICCHHEATWKYLAGEVSRNHSTPIRSAPLDYAPLTVPRSLATSLSASCFALSLKQLPEL